MSFKLSKTNSELLENLVKKGFFSNKGKAVEYAVSKLENYEKLNPIYNEIKSQKDWIKFHNKQEGEAKGKRMINAIDIYEAGKSNSNEQLEILRKYFNKLWSVVTGTRIIFNDISGKIIHNYKSKVARPIEIKVAKIPEYSPRSPDEFISIKEVVEGAGLEYTQALFNTKDNANVIIETLEKLSQKEAEKIAFYTPERYGRRDYPERVVKFGYGINKFDVIADNGWQNEEGYSLGVILNCAVQENKKP